MQNRCMTGHKRLFVFSAVSFLVLLLATTGIVAGSRPTSALDNGDDTGFTTTFGPEQDSIHRARYYARTNYEWPFATGPFYGDVAPEQRRMPGTLLTQVGSFRIQEQGLPFPAELRTINRLGELPAQYFVVELDPASFATQEAVDSLVGEIEAGGGAVITNMAISSYLARLTPEAMNSLSGRSGILHIEPYHPAFKLSPKIGRLALSDPLRATSDVYTLEVEIFQGEDAAAVASQLAAMGGNVLNIRSNMIVVEIHRSKLASVASLEPVFRVNEFYKQFARGEETTNVMQAGSFYPGGIHRPRPFHAAGIQGSGQVLMVLDSGVSIDAGDLSDTATAAGTIGTGHRKVLENASTGAFGGLGDQLSCDDPALGGFTHGQIVSATALGWATNDLPGGYGTPWQAFDTSGNPYALDGVAPQAKLVFYDGNVTPATGNCGDAENAGISPGTLYSAPSGGSLGTSYTDTNFQARVTNFSWGSNSNLYTSNASQIDAFITDKLDAMVFVSAGNAGADLTGPSGTPDGIPDEGTLGTPATCKNCVSVGASGNANVLGGRRTERDRAFFSSMGPVDTSGRIAPLLMAPGQERGALGVASEFACRSNDNDQLGPVECDVSEGSAGTSFSSPASAGSALLIRDYFNKGFYPDGTDVNPSNAGDVVSNVSGALVKAVMIASADMLVNANGDDQLNALGANNFQDWRFNNEQGYGRIQLDQALPLQAWSLSAVGMIVSDGAITGGANNISGLDGTVAGVETDTDTFELCDDTQELRVALVWLDPDEAAGNLVNDLNLEVVDPNGVTYFGNYFTDDNDRNGTITSGENCPSIDGNAALDRDAGPWSLPTCGNSVQDTVNPTEAVMLSPDADANGASMVCSNDGTIICNQDSDCGGGTCSVPDAFNQVAGLTGAWTVNVIANGVTGSQNYAVVISGGVCLGSSVRFDQGTYVCNELAAITVNELDDALDPQAGLTEGEISSRVTVDVLDTDGTTVVDTETGIVFTKQGTSLRFVSDQLQMSDGTAPDPGNGVLDVRHGQFVRVTYADEESNVPNGDIQRVATSSVDCTTRLQFGNLVFGKVGANATFVLDGGCETNLRGGFEFGFADEYMDAGESVGYGLAFASNEGETLVDAEASLRCVLPDTDSPATCEPYSTDCTDPNRENNPPCPAVTITDSPKLIGDIPSGSAMAAHFNVEIGTGVTPQTDVEMILGISAPASGKSTPGLAISRHTLDVDENSTYYSTDFPTGGTQVKDYDNDEIENPTVNSDLTDPGLDYRVEGWTWSDLTATNPALNSPWDFDGGDGGFTAGVTSTSDIDSIVSKPTLWSEDLNFNNLLDTGEDRDPAGVGGALDRGYGTAGGCGWQTQNGLASGDGGVWHTGLIGNNSGSSSLTNCLADGNSGPNRCQATESVAGFNGQLMWFEVLQTPEIHKVNGVDHRVELVDFAWNMSMDLADDLSLFTWEFDTDTAALEPMDVKADSGIFNLAGGAYGPVGGNGNPALGGPAHQGQNAGYPMFAQYVEGGSENFNGTAGNNRVGEQSCWFNSSKQGSALGGPFGTAYPPDDDVDDDGDGSTDEFVTANGPLRNSDMSIWNGPDLRVTTMEDIFGEDTTGDTFRGAFGYVLFEGTPQDQPGAKSYGATVDDVVVEWREINLVPDATDCTGVSECASMELQTTNFYEGSAVIEVTAIERSPWTRFGAGINDCNFDGDGLDPDDDNDCDNDGTPDIVVEVYSPNREDSEVIYLNQTGNMGGDEFKGSIPISPTFDVDGRLVNGSFENGSLFVSQVGTQFPFVTAEYIDEGCNDDPDPAKQGLRSATTAVLMPLGRMSVVTYSLTDDGDNDGYADAGETVDMTATFRNNTGSNLTNVIARVSSNSPTINCVSNPTVALGSFGPYEEKTATVPFTFQVADTANRAGVFDDLTAEFNVSLSGADFDTLVSPIKLVMDLDLNVATAGSGPTTFLESFDSGTFGAFTTMNLDATVSGTNAASDGYRCQYSNPDFINSNAYGRTVCFLGQSFFGEPDEWYDFHTHTPTNSPDGGRAFSGNDSLHMGSHPDAANAGFDTYHLSQLDAIATTNPVNLDTAATSVLSFKHQVSLIDSRTVNSPGGETPDRGVVMVKKVNNSGLEQGVWIKIFPYKNLYHSQGTDNFTECVFDPIDDGSNEDDFFDPTDPNRRLGPSSTCFPEFVFTDLGHTGFQSVYNPTQVGSATDGLGESFAGSVGPGTWVESAFDLSRFRGFRLKLRFLFTSIGVAAPGEDYNELFGLPEGWTGDDGWYIDDVTVTNALSNAATLGVDTATPAPAATCSTLCSGLSAALASNLPADTVAAPGGVVELTAEGSSATVCVDGTLQYQFWSDDNNNSLIEGTDTMLRDWTDNPVLVEVPPAETNYGVKARCSSTNTCSGTDTAFLTVTVNCPASGNLGFNDPIGFNTKTSIDWASAFTVDAIEGDLGTLLAGASFANSVNSCLVNDVNTNSVSAPNTPVLGSGFYYLVRQATAGTFCNEGTQTWGDAKRDGELPSDPDTCP